MSAVEAQPSRTRRRATLALAVITSLVAVADRTISGGPTTLPAPPPSPSRPLTPSAASWPLAGPGERGVRPPTSAPPSFVTAFERGVAAYNADDPDAAVDAFEEAVRLAPDDAEARINLGLVYLRLRRADDGIRELHEGARLEQRRGVAARTGPDATIRERPRP